MIEASRRGFLKGLGMLAAGVLFARALPEPVPAPALEEPTNPEPLELFAEEEPAGMAGYLDLDSMNEVLKELYSGERIQDLVYADNPFIKLLG